VRAHHEQLDSIQAMLAAGHRSVHLERHTLALIGCVGAFLIAATEVVFTIDFIPDHRQRAMAVFLWLAVWLGGVSLLDHRLTQRARRRRDETLPFAQAQITRAWWMLLTMGTLASFAMFFYGGGAMIYCLWIVLIGLGIYLFGLFSRRIVEWIGLAAILLGVTALGAGVPYGTTRWLCAACFAIGMPVVAWLAQRVDDASMAKRLAGTILWLALVAGPPLAFARLAGTAPPLAGEPVLHLAADTRVPLRIEVEGSLLAVAPGNGAELVLKRPVDVALTDGQPDGRYRIGEGAWHKVRDGVLELSIDRVRPQLAAGKPEVLIHGALGGREFEETVP
jgi:hypothetical protein